MKAVFALNSKIKLTQLPVKVALNIFDAVILPILLHGSEIWEPYLNQDNMKWESNDIEKVHTQYIKRILGPNRSTTNMLVHAKVGRFSLQTKALQRNIKYIKYLRSKSNGELANHTLLYEQTKSMSRATIESSILENLNVLENQQLSLYNLPDRKLKTSLHEMNQRQWLNNVNSSSKCDSFKKIKNRVKFENYLTDVTNRKHRVAMSKLCTSDHKLMIEEKKAKNRNII